jgi:hypothetical protein
MGFSKQFNSYYGSHLFIFNNQDPLQKYDLDILEFTIISTNGKSKIYYKLELVNWILFSSKPSEYSNF